MSLMTVEQLQSYSGVVQEDTSMQQIYLDAAENVVEDYLGKALIDFEVVPGIVKLTILRIASLMESESGGNIGVTSKQFGESGTRTFVKTTDYSPYLLQIACYKKV